MLEKIDIKNIYSADRLTRLNRQTGKLPRRQFNRQLKEEEKKEKKNRSGKTDESVDYNRGITDESVIDEENNDKTLNAKKEGDNAQGDMIDIRI